MPSPSVVQPRSDLLLELGIPRECFVSRDWFERDLEAVFKSTWTLVAHTDELGATGSYMTVALGDDELVLVRGEDGIARAFHNFCRHRGHRLCTEPAGTVRRNIICPYHGWAYARDSGALVAVTRMPREFNREPWGLVEAWVEEYHGLIFLSLADERPRGVAESAEKFGLGGYDLGQMKLAARDTIDIAANWKIVVENDDECYHCSLNHPELCENFDPWTTFTTVYDPDHPQHLWTQDDWAIEELGVQQSPKYLCKIPAPRSDGADQAAPDVQLFWQPSGHIIMMHDHAWIWSIKPIAPDRTQLNQYWLVAADAVEDEDYSVDELTWLFKTTMAQDAHIAEQVQMGMEMPRYTPGPLNPYYQGPAAAFYSWYRDKLRAHGQQAPETAVAPLR